MAQVWSGLLLVQARASQHVLALPMLHTSDERHYSYLCSCEDMMPGLQVLTGLDSITNPKVSTLLAPAGLSRISACLFSALWETSVLILQVVVVQLGTRKRAAACTAKL